ncbi:hypothetical protein [Streptomyces sp. NPDC093109]|uniref:hypothetical protein n=1 Tax=Streptomyces sp. NPDC093109 TaxID=3154977 RepID=UPI00344B4930
MTTPPPADHVGVTDIGEMLKVSRQRANQLAARTDFPAPVVQTRAGRLWDRAAVEQWATAWDRHNPGGRPPTAQP